MTSPFHAEPGQRPTARKAKLESYLRNYILIAGVCVSVSALAFLLKPHDCKPTYGPPPYYYNTDLALWLSLADKPVQNLGGSILGNRPGFACMGWLFAQPAKLLVGNAVVSSPTRARGTVSVRLSTIAGLFAATYSATS